MSDGFVELKLEIAKSELRGKPTAAGSLASATQGHAASATGHWRGTEDCAVPPASSFLPRRPRLSSHVALSTAAPIAPARALLSGGSCRHAPVRP
jgi:hypothetical protein